MTITSQLGNGLKYFTIFSLKFSICLAYSQFLEYFFYSGKNIVSWLWLINETRSVNMEAHQNLEKMWGNYNLAKSIKINSCVILIFFWLHGKRIIRGESLSSKASHCFHTALASYFLGFPENILADSLHWHVPVHAGFVLFFALFGYSVILSIGPGRRIYSLIGCNSIEMAE